MGSGWPDMPPLRRVASMISSTSARTSNSLMMGWSLLLRCPAFESCGAQCLARIAGKKVREDFRAVELDVDAIIFIRIAELRLKLVTEVREPEQEVLLSVAQHNIVPSIITRLRAHQDDQPNAPSGVHRTRDRFPALSRSMAVSMRIANARGQIVEMSHQRPHGSRHEYGLETTR